MRSMRRGWHKKWRENGWLNYRNEPVANRDLWERLLEVTQRHQEVEKDLGTLQDRRTTQERERPGRRARRGRQKGGNETLKIAVTMTNWPMQNTPKRPLS
jgi:ribonuclease HI